ncbi:MAG: hypothetical protein CMH83_08045 [Nocardioides sp.]|nr:hypothetical protein [Nocardioides sp.]
MRATTPSTTRSTRPGTPLQDADLRRALAAARHRRRRQRALATTALVLGTSGALAAGAGGVSYADEPPPYSPGPDRERGIVVECHSPVADGPLSVVVYENSLHGNHVDVLFEEGGAHGSRDTARDLARRGTVRAAVKVHDGDDTARAVVRGTVKRVGPTRHVHEEVGELDHVVVSDGTHRRLRTDLALRYDGRTWALDCSGSFAYDLTVTREPAEG